MCYVNPVQKQKPTKTNINPSAIPVECAFGLQKCTWRKLKIHFKFNYMESVL